MLIDSLVKIVPVTLDCDVSLVDPPRAADGSREPAPTLLELGRVANNPAHDSGVRNHNAALRHHRRQISVTQLVRDVPAHRQNYDLGVEVPLQIDRVTFQRLRQSLPRRPYRTTLRDAPEPRQLARPADWVVVIWRIAHGERPLTYLDVGITYVSRWGKNPRTQKQR